MVKVRVRSRLGLANEIAQLGISKLIRLGGGWRGLANWASNLAEPEELHQVALEALAELGCGVRNPPPPAGEGRKCTVLHRDPRQRAPSSSLHII